MNDSVTASPYPTAKCKKPCKYYSKDRTCCYYLDTGIRRPCPVGADCTVYEYGNRVPPIDEYSPKKPPKKTRISWDVETAKKMRDEGASYREIAKALGVHYKTVEDYAIKFWHETSFREG